MLETDRVTLSKAIEPTHYALELSPDFTTLVCIYVFISILIHTYIFTHICMYMNV
jgi:hypothetical protein